MPANLDKEKRIKLGINIRKYRKLKHWSQKKLSLEARVYLATVGKIERGEVDGRFFSICALADAMEINIDVLRK